MTSVADVKRADLAGPGIGAMWWVARGEDRLPLDLHWLTPAEATYADGLRYTKRRTEYLLRRLTAKHAVAAVLGLPTEPATLTRVEVRNRSSGAPYVLLDGRPCGLAVSISDRAGWAVGLVTRAGIAIGCDLELVESRSPGFIADFLTRVEQAYVTAQQDADGRAAAANLVWSAKESALKVLRTGLRRDTRTVEATVHDGQTHGWAAMTVRTAEGATLPVHRGGRRARRATGGAGRAGPSRRRHTAALVAGPAAHWRAGWRLCRAGRDSAVTFGSQSPAIPLSSASTR
jgi:4'-phosphopantetheinyl transferase